MAVQTYYQVLDALGNNAPLNMAQVGLIVQPQSAAAQTYVLTNPTTPIYQVLSGAGATLLSITNAGVVNVGNLTASKLVFTDASKNLTSTGIGTSGQFIKGDGSLDSNTYLTSSTGVTGTGVSGQISYWSGTNTQSGNANFVYNGSSILTTPHIVSATTVTYSLGSSLNFWLNIYGNNILSNSSGLSLGHSGGTTNIISTNGTTAAVFLKSAAVATANYGSLSIGSGAWDGSTTGFFVGNVAGTYLAINAPSGYTGDYFNYQIAGVSKVKADYTGAVTATSLTTSGGITTSGKYVGSISNSTGLTDFLINPIAKTTGNYFDVQNNSTSRLNFSDAGGIIMNLPSGSTQLFLFQVNGSNKMFFTTGGGLNVYHWIAANGLIALSNNTTVNLGGLNAYAIQGASVAIGASSSTGTNSTSYTGASVAQIGTINYSTIVQTGTSSMTDFVINRVETSLGSGLQLLQDWQVGGVSLVKLDNKGRFFPVQAATTSAPTYVKGAVYFDTTLNKLRIGGATAWETVTSV